MRKYFKCEIEYWGEKVTVAKTVTDNMEERDAWKRGYACGWIRDFAKKYTGTTQNITGAQLVETDKLACTMKETLETMMKIKIAKVTGKEYNYGRR